MWFSKTKNSHKPAHKATPVARPAPQAHRPAPPREQLGALGLSNQEVMRVEDVPQGRFLSFTDFTPPIPASFADSFALLQTSPTETTVLMDREQFGGHAFHDVRNRLMKSGRKELRFMASSLEVIKAVHANNRATDTQVTDKTTHEAMATEIINTAIEMGASDIHIESRPSHADVYFRVHGERVKRGSLARETATGVCNVLYTVQADADNKSVSWDPTQVQNASISAESKDGRKYQIRFASGPIHPAGNFHCVMRLLSMDAQTAKSLDEIGYTPAQVNDIDRMLVGSAGIVLLSGPTNSGKSTSLQTFLRRTRDRRGQTIKIITVEDPVEYIVPGACQMGVPSGRRALEDSNGSIFNTYLKGTLRMDPDVVMVGEIRDGESAGAVKDLVLAGRKILSTLHAYEALAVYPRLEEIGVEKALLHRPGFISGIIWQRLVPVLCPHCKVPASQDNLHPDTRHRLMTVPDLDLSHVYVRRDGGCDHCKQLGIIGRTPCAEIVIPDETFLAFIRKGDENGARDHWKSNQALNVDGLGVGAVAHGIQKIRAGMVDPHDVETQISEIRVDHQANMGGYAANQSYMAAPQQLVMGSDVVPMNEREIPAALRYN